MPAYDKFIIAPYSDGLVQNRKPWLIPNDAFSTLRNAYVFRDRLRKRWGSTLINPDGLTDAQISSRLRIQVGTTDGAGDIIAGSVPSGVLTVGQQFSIGTEIYTVNQTGVAVTMLSTGGGSGAVTTGVGSFTITGAPINTAVYWYPLLPVMGILIYEQGDINAEQTVFFDTRYAYIYSASGFTRLGTQAWKGTETDFFWGSMYRGAVANDQLLFVTNFYLNNYGGGDYDPMRYWDGSAWNDFVPDYNSGGNAEIVTCRIIIQFKNRLLLFNTWENDGAGTIKNYRNRCRFSQNGTPFGDAFYEPPGTYGKGDKIDAPTNEAIVTAQFLRDRLIVFFERSTWEIVYTGNQVLPFVWQKINTELGVESTNSIVPFDKVVMGIGDVGVHACTGTNVQRIDQNIPNEVYTINNVDGGLKRVTGIRDYDGEFVYWSYPSISVASDPTWPNRVLVYNYENGAWAFFDDSITAFGYYQPNFALTWENATMTWEEALWSWSSGQIQSRYRTIVAGNQEGFVFSISRNIARNAPALSITDISVAANIVTLTVINHNLQAEEEWIYIENCTGITSLNDTIFPVNEVIDANTITIDINGITGTYTGGGTIARASQIEARTKPYNFYTNQAANIAISKVDFNVNRTPQGAITVDYSPSFSTLSLVEDGILTNTIQGTNVLETSAYATIPLEAVQDQLWHPLYFYGQAETISFKIYLSNEQMLDSNVVFSDFQLNAMIIHAQPGSSRLE